MNDSERQTRSLGIDGCRRLTIELRTWEQAGSPVYAVRFEADGRTAQSPVFVGSRHEGVKAARRARDELKRRHPDVPQTWIGFV